MQSKPALLWFRRDLRLADNPALIAACRHKNVVPVFIWSPEEEKKWAAGAASRWWFHHSLSALGSALQSVGSRLVIRRGPTVEVLTGLIREIRAGTVYWNCLYEPLLLKRDTRIKEALRKSGVQVESFNAALLHEPWYVLNRQEKPFRVFTPFWRTCQEQDEPGQPALGPRFVPAPPRWPRSLDLAELNLLPKRRWADGFSKVWKPGEKGAQRRLKNFLDESLPEYPLAAIFPPMREHQSFRRICILAKSGRDKSGTRSRTRCGNRARQVTRRPEVFSVSWAGVNSPITCFITSRSHPKHPCTQTSRSSRGEKMQSL